MDLRVADIVPVDIVLRLLRRDAELLGQAKSADAVNNAEIDSLRMTALLVGDFFEGDAQHFGRGAAVDVLMVRKGSNQALITAHMRKNTELDLRVVRRDEAVIALARYKKGAYLLPFLRADRDVLQVRIRA